MKGYFESEKQRMTNPKPIKQYVIPWIKGSPGPLKDESCDNTEKKFNINLYHSIQQKSFVIFFLWENYTEEKKALPEPTRYCIWFNIHTKISLKVLWYLCNKCRQVINWVLAKDWLIIGPVSPWTHPVPISSFPQNVHKIEDKTILSIVH